MPLVLAVPSRPAPPPIIRPAGFPGENELNALAASVAAMRTDLHAATTAAQNAATAAQSLADTARQNTPGAVAAANLGAQGLQQGGAGVNALGQAAPGAVAAANRVGTGLGAGAEAANTASATALKVAKLFTVVGLAGGVTALGVTWLSNRRAAKPNGRRRAGAARRAA